MREFGKMPHEWDRIDKRSKAEAMAFVSLENLIESYQMQDLGNDTG